MVQNLPYLYSKFPLGERLLDEVHAFIQKTSMGYDIGGITRHKEDLQVRVKSFYLQGQILPVHFRHDHVGNQEIKSAGELSGQAHCFSR